MRGLPLLIFGSAMNANWGIRHMRAAGIAARIGAEPQGNNWRCDCPCGCGYGLSFCDGANGRLLAFCFGGCEFDQILAALIEFGLFDDDDGDDPHVSRPVIVCHRDNATRIADAQAIYASGTWDSRIAVYLRSRWITLTSPVLRFLEQTPHRLGAHLPAILAPVVDVNGGQTGTHLTYLRRDGAGKADLPKEYQRECRGVTRGGAIRLAEHDPNAELIIGQGVESTFSAMQLFCLAGWAAVSAAGLKTMELPPDVRRIILAADNDTSGAGQRASLGAYDRWRAEGRQVCIKTPPVIGTDFNDLLFNTRAR
jgi:putative DNA primase/helicase